jgi:arylsulfatase A-like enzyme
MTGNAVGTAEDWSKKYEGRASGEEVGQPRDLVLVTVDCWRYDAPGRMPTLKRATEGFVRGDAISQAAATNGVFPTILASQYFHEAYRGMGTNGIRDDVVSLPGVLREAGYTTGAFLGSNPFLGKWQPYFDTFWNDGMRAHDEDQNREAYGLSDRIRNLLTLTPRVTATEVTERAQTWFNQTNGPRFCWIHLMDTHGPYYPGLSRGRSVGLLDAYQALIQYSRQGMDASEPVLNTIRELYWQCVEQLDEQMAAVLEFVPSDAAVVITADHGEELHHGYIGHARLYDECARVPCYVRPPPEKSVELPVPMRHLDLAPTLVDWLDLHRPDVWAGTPYDGTPRDSFQLNRSFIGGEERVYAGLRTERAKLVEVYDQDGRRLDRECYDLVSDPDEQQVLDPTTHTACKELTSRLREFLQGTDVVDSVVDSRRDADETVRQRLEELGYR